MQMDKSDTKGEGRKPHRRGLLLGLLPVLLAGKADWALASVSAFEDGAGRPAVRKLRQSGADFDRVLKVATQIWGVLGRPQETLVVGMIDTKGVRAEVTSGGRLWMTTGFLEECQLEAELAVWLSQRAGAIETKASGEALDRIALETLLAAGYDPRAVVGLWGRWAASKSLRNSSGFADLPLSPVRLARLRAQIEKLGYLV